MTKKKPYKKKSSSRRNLLVIASVVFLLVALGAAYAYQDNFRSLRKSPVKTVAPSAVKPATEQPKDETIRIIASGDELPHLTLSDAARTTEGYDYKPFFAQVKPIFSRADVRFCNQEAVSAAPDVGPVTGYPAFNAPREFAAALGDVGCNVISTANNHANDKGQAGVDVTLDVWKSIPHLALAGTNKTPEDQQKVQYFTEKNVRFAFLAYSYFNNIDNAPSYRVNMFDEALMTKQLAEARQQSDFIIVSMHWGTEYSPGIDATQERWSAFLAANGADLVVGTGPHVLQPVKQLPRSGGGVTTVFYSLGNLLSAQLDIESLIGGFAVVDLQVKQGQKPQLQKVAFLPTYMHYEWTPAQKAAEDLAARTNFKLVLLEEAEELMKRSQNNTTVLAQQQRVTALLSTYMPVPILSGAEYLK